MNISAGTIDRLLQDVVRNSGLDITYTLSGSTEDEAPLISVEFAGPDKAMLVARNAELLLALEHVAARMLRLEPEQYDLLHFESGGFKATRSRLLQRMARTAVKQVRSSEQPYAFPAMSSHERRLLHLALAPSGLLTGSEGEGPLRHLVLYPARREG